MRAPGPGSPAPFGQSPGQPANAPAHMVARPATAARCDARRQRRARIGLRAQQPRAGHRGDPGPRARRATFLPERRPLPSWAGKVPCRDRPIAVATKRAARALQPTATARGRRCGLPVRGALASHEDRPSPRRRRSAACKFWSFFLGIYLAARPEKIRIVQIRAARLVLANTRRQAGQLAPGRRLVRVDRTRSNARAAPRDLRRRAGRGERAGVAPPLARREFATPSAPKNQLGSLKRERERKSKEREREREEE